MKKNIFLRFNSLLLAVIMLSSCEKQIQQQDTKAGDVVAKTGNNANVEKRCRLLVDKGLSDGFIQSYHYNEKGLSDEFHIFKPNEYNQWATMKYDSRNLLSNAKYFYAIDDYYDIVFTYDEDKRINETWYYPGTDVVFDYYINTYNAQGRLIKRDDPPFELYTIFHYDAAGNTTLTEIFDYQGNLWLGIAFEFTKPIKNPFASVTGLPTPIFYLDDHIDKIRFTGLKYYFNDDQGNQVIIFNWKSEETEIIAGAENYPVYQNSRDDVSGVWTDQTWTYENCAGNSEVAHSGSAVSSASSNPFKNLLHAKKSSHYKQDIMDFRTAFLTRSH